MTNLEQRKADLRSRIAALHQELAPHLANVENLRERITHLESDLRDVFDQIREAEVQARREEEARRPAPPKKEWVRTI